MSNAARGMMYRPDIDGLRAAAVLAVVFYHAGLGFPGGFLGVDVFFVISGYLIVKIIYDPMIEGSFSVTEFYVRRARRLFPAMFAMMLVTALWASWQLIAPDLEDFGASLIAALAYVPNVYFYFTNSAYFSETALSKPLLHTWSLGVEEQFYVIAPLLLWALVRLTPRRVHVPAITILIALSFGLSVWKPAWNSLGGFYLLPGRAWEIALGGALALAAPRFHARQEFREVLSLCGVGAIAYVFLTGWESDLPAVWQMPLAAGGAAAILVSGTGRGALVHRLLGIGPVTFFGKISYSLYLWHWPVFVSLSYGRQTPVTTEWSLIGLGVSVALAAASWRWVEQPIRLSRLLPRKKRLIAASALATGAGMAIGAILVVTRGLPERHPELAMLLDEARTRSPRLECGVVSAEMAAADTLCVRGAPGVRPNFILVGDSHAHALSNGLFEAASRGGAAGAQFTAPGFFPLPEWETEALRRRAFLMPALENFLLRHPELRTIIVAAFWSHAASGRSYREPLGIHSGSGYGGTSAEQKRRSFQRALERLVRRFPQRRFILLDDVPTGEVLGPRQIARQVFTKAGMSAGLPRATADRQRVTYEPTLKAVASAHPNVLYVPALSALCGEHMCPALDSAGKPLYQDGDHLSAHGSMQVASWLEPLFAPSPRR